jgi:hypothetical protein
VTPRQVSSLLFALAGAGVLYMFTAIALAHYVIKHDIHGPMVREVLVPMVKAAPFLVPAVIVLGVVGVVVRVVFSSRE